MSIKYLTNAETEEAAEQELAGAARDTARAIADGAHCGLVLDGQTFQLLVRGGPARLKSLYRLLVDSKTCVCCRLSPSQKRRLVEVVKENDTQAITLAIGDGA